MNGAPSREHALSLGMLALLGACATASSRSSTGGPDPVAPERCDGASAQACVDAGRAMERKRKLEGAGKLYAAACEAQSAEGCRRAARASFGAGLGVAHDVARALELERRACDLGDGIACATMAERYWTADRVFPDEKLARGAYAKSVPLLEKACGADDLDACARLGVVLTNGWGLLPDLARAERTNTKAAALAKARCDAGDGEACDFLARALARGRGIAKDAPASAKAFARSCELEWASACFELTHNGDDRAAVTRYVEVEEGACRAGDAEACGRAAQACATSLHDEARATELHRRGCERDRALSCRELARADAGAAKRAREALTAACDHGDGRACGALGDLANAEKDAASGRAALERGCKLADAESCLALGATLTGDPDRAREAFEKACNLGKKAGCDKATGPRRR